MTDVRIRPGIETMVVAAAAGLFSLIVLQLVVRWARFIPQPNPAWDYSVAVLWAMLLAGFILLWPIGRDLKFAVSFLWLARCAVTLGAMLPYEGNYATLDGYTYFGASLQNGFDASQLGFQSGTSNMLQLAALHHLLLPDSYHALKVSFAFIGLIGVFVLYRACVLLLRREDLRVLLLLGLFPSILFWSSIVGKEPIVVLGTALYVFGVVGWLVERRKRFLLAILAGIALAAFIRIWNVPILLLPLLLPLWMAVQGGARRALFLGAALLASVLAVKLLAARFVIASTADLLSAAELWSQAWAVGGSARTIDVDFTSIGSILAFMPRGAFAALFRPLPGEVMNPFGLLAGLENLLLLAMALLAIVRITVARLKHPLALWALSLIVLWSAVYGIFSYQNLGTAMRFKVQILPVLLGLLVYALHPRWLIEKGNHEAG